MSDASFSSQQGPRSVPPPQPLTFTIWLILIMASIGFAFDIYELLMLPLVLPGALQDLLPGVSPGSSSFNNWRALMFWVPAMAGGLFGLLGGYLTDRLGRRRVLTWSILLYAFSAFAAGFSTSMPMLLVLRSLCFIGVCVEFVAAVAWLAELFPNPGQRERALGYTQAFSSVGGLLVGGVFLTISHFARSLPPITMPGFLEPLLGPIQAPQAPWRYTLMSGLVPALPLILIRPFLPESPVWKQKKESGTLRRASFGELFSPALQRTTIVTTIMVALSYGAAFGAIQQMPQIVPALPEYGSRIEKARNDAGIDKLSGKAEEKATKQVERQVRGKLAGNLSLFQEVGGLVGRFLLALLVVRIVSRRALIRVFQVPGLVVMPLTFVFCSLNNRLLFTVGELEVTLFHVGMFLAGLLTVAQFSFWGNYLPTVYPVHLRGTGESMAANVGGRMIGTSFAAITSIASGLAFIPGSTDAERVAYTAAGIGLLVYLLGFLCSFFLPEPKEEMMHE